MTDTKKGAAPDNTAPKPKVGRSPSYPDIDLETAIGHTRAVYEKNAKTNHPIAFELAVEHCGFTKKSSAGRLQLAALRKYGLIDYVGSGDKRMIKLTDRALDILTDERENSIDRAKRIAEAAFEPDIFREIYKRWDGKLLDEATVKFYLRREKGYTDSAVPDLITSYQRTIEFVKRQSSGTMPSVDTDKQDGNIHSEEEAQMQDQGKGNHSIESSRKAGLMPPPPPQGMKEYLLPLLTSDDAVLRVPDGMSEEDWGQMIDVLNVMKRGILAKSRRAAEEATEDDEPN